MQPFFRSKGIYLILVLIFILLILNFKMVFALDLKSQMDKFAGKAEIKTETDLVTIIGKIVGIVISFLGLIAVIIVIIGGFKWMTSGGNEESVTKAKKLMISGLIGLAIIVLAYAVASFVITQLGEIAAPSAGEGQINPYWTPDWTVPPGP